MAIETGPTKRQKALALLLLGGVLCFAQEWYRGMNPPTWLNGVDALLVAALVLAVLAYPRGAAKWIAGLAVLVAYRSTEWACGGTRRSL